MQAQCQSKDLRDPTRGSGAPVATTCRARVLRGRAPCPIHYPLCGTMPDTTTGSGYYARIGHYVD